MAELHVLGQLFGGSGFGHSDLFCKWSFVTGDGWRLLEGNSEGQTQVDTPEDSELAVWAHPIDVHYAAKTVVGWPKLHFQVWNQDMLGRSSFLGYGFCHIPTAPGTYRLEAPTWRPLGTPSERLSSFFFGAAPQLINDETVYSTADRFRVRSASSGVVHVHIDVIAKDFAKYGVQLSG
eukprot:TRINITY_DN10051_c0_g1_i1.p1 TRINITY_DN10051_c0_g1~~TRINITY_DN10051_c0_g1_i1.p1  ORF type:complete len:192 (+),score=14.17 TRINITY_DN10051_c0_g1_i1:45-578(+)